MYSVLVSKIVKGMNLTKDFLKNKIKANYKVVVLPWGFPDELDSNKLMNEYFKKGGEKYNKYIDPLKELGIDEKNIYIADCYGDSSKALKEKIEQSDILVLPGGNPEMFYSKVVMEKELLYVLKYYKGFIIGESAGAVFHQKRYFITAKNNYYKYFAFYDGFGIIDDPFYLDVHSTNNKLYLNKLQKIANEKNKKIYAIFDDGAIIYNRKNKEIKIFGNVKEFNKEV
jgi:peptidase E